MVTVTTTSPVPMVVPSVSFHTVEAFENELARFCGARHALGCNSGTDALWLALRARELIR